MAGAEGMSDAEARADAAPAFVVDASVSAAWLLPDEATAATEAALQAIATSDVWVPSGSRQVGAEPLQFVRLDHARAGTALGGEIGRAHV